MRRRVSGATPTLKEDVSKNVTVRQVPFTLMLSPRWQSWRISEALEMVSVVPPSSAWGLSSETTRGDQKLFSLNNIVLTSDYLYYSSKHSATNLKYSIRCDSNDSLNNDPAIKSDRPQATAPATQEGLAYFGKVFSVHLLLGSSPKFQSFYLYTIVNHLTCAHR